MSSDLNNWAKKYEDLTNSDETIAAMAIYYSCSFMFVMEWYLDSKLNFHTLPTPNQHF